MDLIDELPEGKLTPSRLWSAMDVETRRIAAGSLYEQADDDASDRREAENAIAKALRFRPESVRKLPAARRADYLARVVCPDDSLASSLLIALHLVHRRPMLSAFLDELGIPQHGGLIDSGHEIDPLDAAQLESAVARLRESFPTAEVELYLASLAAMDADVWSGLEPILRERP